jgi:hypothetical protein
MAVSLLSAAVYVLQCERVLPYSVSKDIFALNISACLAAAAISSPDLFLQQHGVQQPGIASLLVSCHE